MVVIYDFPYMDKGWIVYRGTFAQVYPRNGQSDFKWINLSATYVGLVVMETVFFVFLSKGFLCMSR